MMVVHSLMIKQVNNTKQNNKETVQQIGNYDISMLYRWNEWIQFITDLPYKLLLYT